MWETHLHIDSLRCSLKIVLKSIQLLGKPRKRWYLSFLCSKSKILHYYLREELDVCILKETQGKKKKKGTLKIIFPILTLSQGEIFLKTYSHSISVTDLREEEVVVIHLLQCILSVLRDVKLTFKNLVHYFLSTSCSSPGDWEGKNILSKECELMMRWCVWSVESNQASVSDERLCWGANFWKLLIERQVKCHLFSSEDSYIVTILALAGMELSFPAVAS